MLTCESHLSISRRTLYIQLEISELVCSKAIHSDLSLAVNGTAADDLDNY